MTAQTLLAGLARDAAAAGLALRETLHPTAADDAPLLDSGQPIGTLVLLGFTGGQQWPVYARSPEAADGQAHPLDRWSRRVIDDLARRHAAAAFYPSDGPPWLPFQRWAMRGGEVHVSPLGLLIHAEYGLWHAYRGALAFAERLPLAVAAPVRSPCLDCADRPCLRTCPVGAVQASGFARDDCRRHVRTVPGNACRTGGCLARLSCPVGRSYHYGAEQASFHMDAVVRS